MQARCQRVRVEALGCDMSALRANRNFRHYLTGESGVVEIESPWTEYYRATKGPALAKTGLERGTQVS